MAFCKTNSQEPQIRLVAGILALLPSVLSKKKKKKNTLFGKNFIFKLLQKMRFGHFQVFWTL
jgi:hypothetical protein